MQSLIQKTKEWVRSGSGLIVPSDVRKGYQCGYCPNVIFLENESNGRLFITGGKPCCAKCRILNRSRYAGQIRKDKQAFDKDQVVLEGLIQKSADDLVKRVALQSQENHKDSKISK